ncbi:MAG: hypothetical protein KC502_05930 [Myxococcales bacterium]|nr:hypothetical protein [Myxococcales bacterium]
MPWRTLLTIALVTAFAQAPVSQAEGGWGARKKPAATPAVKRKKKRRARRRGRKRRRVPRSARHKPVVQPAAPLAERVDALLQRRRWSSRAAIVLMREAVAGRDMGLALRLARAVAAAKRVPAADLVDAAKILGQGYPVQLQLWRRAGRSRRVPRWLQRTVDEGLFDALMATGKHKEARKVLDRALKRARIGTRHSLFERLVAWGRVAGEVDDARETLLRWRDPDAAVLAARLVAELDGELAAVATLRKAFARYPGHRTLQKALIDALARQGARDELAKVVARVVRLAPSDPMPWLTVVDAHIGARDKRGARKLIDRLVKTYPRRDVLIESLIDREQRLGEDRKRLRRMFVLLIKANPKNPSYLEAYGEWLLAGGRTYLAAAVAVLKRLESLPAGPYEGMRRMASILQAHGHVREAQQTLLRMKTKFPNKPETTRLLAILFGQTGRDRAAEQGWMTLLTLPPNPDARQRQLAGDARRSLISLYRKTGWLLPRMKKLKKKLASGKGSLGDTLLHLDLVAGEAELGGERLPLTWLTGSHPMAKKWGADPEVAAALARAELQQGRLKSGLQRIVRLAKVDIDRAQVLLVALVERGLATQQLKLVAEAESILEAKTRVVTSQLLHLGDLHMRSGDVRGATGLYRRAARNNPRDTRAVARLAQMFRQAGEIAEEMAALRSIVVRTVDAEELNRAGQRLLTLAMRAGSAAGLLRWLDAVTPKHPRRQVIERFRLLAYDVWLRTAPLERLLGSREKAPGPAMLSEAMASGDLALRVRALRQAALAHRRLPPALGRRLLKDSNAAIRRLTILALAASGSLEATQLLVEMEAEGDWQVRVAQLLAFAQLPSLPEAEPFLVQRLQERNTAWSSLAALSLGRVGGVGAMQRMHKIAHARSALRAPIVLALGAMVGRMSSHHSAADIVASLAGWANVGRGNRLTAFFQAYANLWALAATGRDDAKAILLERAASLDSRVLRGVAVRLAGAERPPSLKASHWQVKIDWGRRYNVADAIMRRVLLRWLAPDPAAMSAAIGRIDTPLARLLSRRFHGDDGFRDRWCNGFEGTLAQAPQIRRLCADVQIPPRR